MICPSCHVEYRPGFEICADCDVALVDEGDLGAAEEVLRARVDELDLAPFHETANADELGVVLENFEENGIAYVVQAGTALTLLAGPGHAVTLPEEWSARILVPGGHLDRARECLRRLRETAVSGRAAAVSEPPI